MQHFILWWSPFCHRGEEDLKTSVALLLIATAVSSGATERRLVDRLFADRTRFFRSLGLQGKPAEDLGRSLDQAVSFFVPHESRPTPETLMTAVASFKAEGRDNTELKRTLIAELSRKGDVDLREIFLLNLLIHDFVEAHRKPTAPILPPLPAIVSERKTHINFRSYSRRQLALLEVPLEESDERRAYIRSNFPSLDIGAFPEGVFAFADEREERSLVLSLRFFELGGSDQKNLVRSTLRNLTLYFSEEFNGRVSLNGESALQLRKGMVEYYARELRAILLRETSQDFMDLALGFANEAKDVSDRAILTIPLEEVPFEGEGVECTSDVGELLRRL